MTLDHLVGKSIFISRNLKDESLFKKAAKEGRIVLVDESLISFNEIRFSYTPKTDWIFFSSKNAIKYFFSQKPELSTNVKFGVMSSASAEYLMEFEKAANFIGTGVDLTVIAKNFKAVIKDESVLFPQAIDSLKTIQKHLSFINNCHNLFVYKTSMRTDFSIPHCNTLIFTSPSNVQAYLNKYKINKEQTVIAIGTSTKSKLVEHHIENILLSNEFSEQGLFDKACNAEYIN